MIKTFDEIANASYYVLEPSPNPNKVALTVSVSERCNIDLDANGFPIGVEVLFPSAVSAPNNQH